MRRLNGLTGAGAVANARKVCQDNQRKAQHIADLEKRFAGMPTPADNPATRRPA
jgi:hypothetical protein